MKGLNKLAPNQSAETARAVAHASLRPLTIIQVFNDYLQPGGEVKSVARIALDLERGGHRVHRFWRESREWKGAQAPGRWRQPFLLWNNARVLEDLGRLQEKVGADLWLLHNVIPVVSLGIYEMASRRGVPIFQWLHNFRPISPSGTLQAGPVALSPRDPRIYWKETVAGSWNGRLMTGLLSFYYWRLQRRGSFNSVKAWVAVGEEVRSIFEQAGWEPTRLFALRHSWHLTRAALPTEDRGYFLFLGRLTEVKGIRFLIELWKDPAFSKTRLVVAGDGPLREELQRESPSNVEWAGHVEGEAKAALVENCRAILFPSLWPEPLSTVAYEAYEHFKPILSSGVGGMKEVITDRVTGRLLPPGQVQAWREAVMELLHQPDQAICWGRNGRQWLEREVSSEKWNEGFDKIVASALSPGATTTPPPSLDQNCMAELRRTGKPKG